MNCSNYEFFGLELTPTIFSKLFVILCSSGEWMYRNDIINMICNYHTSNGGVCGKREYVSTFKKSSVDLLNCEKIERRGYRSGLYRVLNEYNSDNGNLLSEYSVLGTGSESVYLYYYKTQFKDDSSYLCKIGKTRGSVESRVKSQCSTASLEQPIIGLVIKCDDCSVLERFIHTWLDFLDRSAKGVPGKEWYFTSVDEVKRMYSMLISITN